MTDASNRATTRNVVSVVVACFAIGSCGRDTEPSGVRVPSIALAAKAPGITVTAADPSFGMQGQSNESVRITGSGFAPGAQAAWLRNGVVDTTITVTSTQYVSPTTLVATISISSKSTVDFRDIRVMAAGGRTQGIGNLLFEVTQAVGIPGTSWVRSINDNGEATGTLSAGTGVFYYNIGTGVLETVSPTGTGYDISTTGNAIVGSGGPNGGFAYLYTRTGPGTWQATALPIAATSSGGIARAMRIDGTGQVVQIAGLEYGAGAVSWTWQAATGTWQRIVLPGSGAEVRHRAISDNGILGGIAGAGKSLGPAVWMPNGSGGYTLTLLATKNGAVNGIRSDGQMLVGFTSTPSVSAPMYWLAQPGGTWGAPVTVAGGCNAVKDVADAGRFVLNDCPISNGGQASPAYADAPYGTLSRLGGLGPKNIAGFVSGISHGGHYAGGYAGSQGVYWWLP